MQLRRLYPDGASVAPERALDGLDLGALAPPGRPYVAINMVATVDGHITAGGRSVALSGPADRALFHALRGRVDAVVAGTVTLRVEPSGRLVRTPERRRAREERGLAPDPLAVVLSRSGDVPRDAALFADPAQPVAVLTGAQAEPAAALARLRAEHGVRSLLCEGGPTLNAALLRAGHVDELFLSVSPLLLGGDPESILGGAALEAARELELVWVLEHAGALFLRYRVGDARG